MASRARLLVPPLVLGIVSTTSQVVVIRELLVAFTGNEMVIATTLALWLVGVAGGCYPFRLHNVHRQTERVAAALFIIAGPLSLFQVVLIRLAHPAYTRFGEIPDPLRMLAVSAAGVVPAAMAYGGLFVAIVASTESVANERRLPLIYGLEALGSAIGGSALSLLALGRLNQIGILAVAWLAGVGVAFYPLGLACRPGRRCFTGLTAMAAGSAIIVLAVSPRIDRAARAVMWRPLEVKETVETKYGSLVVTDRGGITDFYESGMLAFTIPDPLYAEETVHIPLACHPDPRRVLVIGGSGSGIVREAVKHPSVADLDYVELDPAATGMVRRHSPEGWLEGDQRARAGPVFGDARSYVSTTPNRYDVVIVNVGEPTSLQINRYYTVEFFRRVRRILHPGGVVATKIASSGAHIGADLAGLLNSIKAACAAAFDSVVVVPGDYMQILASDGVDLGAARRAVSERLRSRGVHGAFVNQFTLSDRLSARRIAYTDSVLARYGAQTPNSDLRPIAFSRAISAWERHFRSGALLRKMVAWLSPWKSVLLLLVLGAVVVALHAFATRSGVSYAPSYLMLYSVGFATMFSQIVILLGFQTASGCVYSRIALLVAGFMIGLGLASVAHRGRQPLRRARARAALVVSWLAAMPLAGVLLLRATGAWPGAPAAWGDVAFIALACLTGLCGGTAFSEVASALSARAATPAEAGVFSYAIDLAGACVAGFSTGLVLVPSLGLGWSAVAVATTTGVFGLPYIAAATASREPQPR